MYTLETTMTVSTYILTIQKMFGIHEKTNIITKHVSTMGHKRLLHLSFLLPYLGSGVNLSKL